MCKRKKIYKRTLFRLTNKKMTGSNRNQPKSRKRRATANYQPPQTYHILFFQSIEYEIKIQNISTKTREDTCHMALWNHIDDQCFSEDPARHVVGFQLWAMVRGWSYPDMTQWLSAQWVEMNSGELTVDYTRSICRTNFENRGKTPSAFCSKRKEWRDRPGKNAPSRPQKCPQDRPN